MTFQHQQTAHCESGVMSSLLSHHGLAISEPMVFGLSNAMAFAYIPLVKLSGQPLIAYRLPPRFIIKSLSKRLGLKLSFQRFRDPLKGVAALDNAIDRGQLVGLQTSVFWLPYFPEEMRFHFNAHNLIVYGRQGREYQVSDPIFEHPVTISQSALNKARFVKGPLAPKGLMYTVDRVPMAIDYQTVIPQAISRNEKIMRRSPLPIIGIRGIHFLANKIVKLKKIGDRHQQQLFLSHIVRMQEEIGTGGAGFRFMYASFLDEAGRILGDAMLNEASNRLTEVGDLWRDFAVTVVKQCRSSSEIDLQAVRQKLIDCAEQEELFWGFIRAWVKERA